MTPHMEALVPPPIRLQRRAISTAGRLLRDPVAVGGCPGREAWLRDLALHTADFHVGWLDIGAVLRLSRLREERRRLRNAELDQGWL